MVQLWNLFSSVARFCAQGDGSDGFWIIFGSVTYEEAYALSVGYKVSELQEISAVLLARKMYEDGTYSHPTSYRILSEIPPRRLLPVHSDSVIPWNVSRDSLADYPLYRYTNRVTDDDVENDDSYPLVRDEGVTLDRNPYEEMTRSLERCRLGPSSSKETVGIVPTPPSHESSTVTTVDEKLFRLFLLKVCSLESRIVDNLWKVVLDSDTHCALGDLLTDAKVSRVHRDFVVVWVRGEVSSSDS